MADITAVFGGKPSQRETERERENTDCEEVADCEEVEVLSSQDPEAQTLVDWSLDPPAMIRIGGDGFTEIAVMETIPTSAFQIARFANGDRIESGYIFELHF